MMSKKDFVRYVLTAVKESLDSSYYLDVRTVRKRNRKVCYGLLASKGKTTNCPIIYLDDAYELYKNGQHIDLICAMIANMIDDDPEIKGLDVDWFLNYATASERLCYMLVSQSLNEEYLRDKPYIPYLDMAIVFYAPVTHGNLTIGTVTVTNQHIENWGVTVDDLMTAAHHNSCWAFPERLIPIDDIINMLKAQDYDKSLTPLPADMMLQGTYVVTNSRMYMGASVVLYDGFLERAYNKIGAEYYVIFSSIHEALLIPVTIGLDANIIKGIHETVGTNDETLSSCVYRYDHSMGRLIICE